MNNCKKKYLWEVTYWDKKFKNLSKSKQLKVIKFIHISSEDLSFYATFATNNDAIYGGG